VSDELGQFVFETRLNKDEQLLLLEVQGPYFDAVSGTSRDTPVSLQGFAILEGEETTANINMLTHLISGRVTQLISDGVALRDAIAQAQTALQTTLPIGAPNVDSHRLAPEQDTLGGDTVENAYLLLLGSVFQQAAQNSDDFSVLLSQVANEFSVYGELRDVALRQRLQDAQRDLDVDYVMSNLGEYVTPNDPSIVVPDLRRVFDRDEDGVSDRDDNCPDKPNSDQAAIDCPTKQLVASTNVIPEVTLSAREYISSSIAPMATYGDVSAMSYYRYHKPLSASDPPDHAGLYFYHANGSAAALQLPISQQGLRDSEREQVMTSPTDLWFLGGDDTAAAVHHIKLMGQGPVPSSAQLVKSYALRGFYARGLARLQSGAVVALSTPAGKGAMLTYAKAGASNAPSISLFATGEKDIPVVTHGVLVQHPIDGSVWVLLKVQASSGGAPYKGHEIFVARVVETGNAVTPLAVTFVDKQMLTTASPTDPFAPADKPNWSVFAHPTNRTLELVYVAAQVGILTTKTCPSLPVDKVTGSSLVTASIHIESRQVSYRHAPAKVVADSYGACLTSSGTLHLAFRPLRCNGWKQGMLWQRASTTWLKQLNLTLNDPQDSIFVASHPSRTEFVLTQTSSKPFYRITVN